MSRTTEKITITILLHIPKYSATLCAWTSAWVNQKGYVTCSYNVMHDRKSLLHIPKFSATVCAWTSTWVNQKGYVTCSIMSRTTERITITTLLHIPNYSATVCAWTSTWVNQKGYVTCSYNVTNDGKNHYHDFVTCPEVLSNCMCMDFNLGEPERICNMVL